MSDMRQAGRRERQQADEATAAAFRAHEAGDLAGAERLYRAALAIVPDHAEGLHGLGVLARGAGRSDLAIAFIGRAVAARPEAAHFYINLGLALLDQGHADEARAALHVAVLRNADDPRAQAAHALALEQLGRDAEAQDAASRALSLGRRLRMEVPGAEAIQGRLQAKGGEDAAALASFRRAVAEAPEDVASWQALALAASRLRALDEAEAAFRRVATLRPEDPAAQANLGAFLFERGQLGEARAHLRQAVRSGVPTAATRSNLGLVLMAEGALGEAERQLAEAATLAPGDSGILNNHGTVLADLGRFEEAEGCFQRACAVSVSGSVEQARATFNRGTVLLATGRLREGWAAFEARRALLPAPAATLPAWDGSSLAGGRWLLLEGEQGLGDAIQFLRYAPLAAARVPVVLRLPEALRQVAATLAGPSLRIIAAEDGVPEECGAWASLLSLPHLLALDALPHFAPYLSAKGAPGDGFSVGLCWAGNPNYRFDRRRSMARETLEPLLATPGVSFVSLQQDCPLTDEAPPHFADFAALAGRIAGLDLVVSVDTAVAHLAGAMGKPVWLLNRFGGDWRWQAGFTAPDGSSLWYPSLRQFRQPAPLPPEVAWVAPVASIAAELARWAETGKAPARPPDGPSVR